MHSESHASLRIGDILINRGFISVPIIPQIDATILQDIESNSIGFNMSVPWHCGTTHCRAGAAINHAGAAGYELERQFGPPTAGALIYIASRPDQPIPNFYDTTERALADIRKCAAEQTAATTE